MKRNNKKGFTIVELVIVIAVIAVLAGIMIPTFGNVIDNANKSAAQQGARNAYTQCYAADLADGVIDGTTDGTTAVTAPADCTYTVSGGVATATCTKGGHKWSFNGSALAEVQ